MALESFKFPTQKDLATHLGIDEPTVSRLKKTMDVSGVLL
jgi:DNA-binding MurR/RpiR family transcriptional regulator